MKLNNNALRPSWRRLLFIFSVTLSVQQVSAVSIITTAPQSTGITGGYRASSYTFANGDVARGFIIFKNGFIVPSGSSVFYDADGPIFGDVNVQGTLQIGSDLRLGTTGWFNINEPGVTATFDGCSGTLAPQLGNTIFMGGDQILTGIFSITSTLTIDGCGHTLTIPANCNFSLRNRSTLTLKNMNMVVSSTTPFQDVNSPSYISLNNVNIYLLNNTSIFGSGATSNLMTQIKGFVGIYGPYTALAQSKNPGRYDNASCNFSNIAIKSASTLYIGPGVTFNLSNLNVPAVNKIGMQDVTSALWLDGCTLTCSNSQSAYRGLNLTGGTVFIDDKVVINDLNAQGNANTDVTKGLIFGSGTGYSSLTDMNVRVLGGAYVILNGSMQYAHS